LYIIPFQDFQLYDMYNKTQMQPNGRAGFEESLHLRYTSYGYKRHQTNAGGTTMSRHNFRLCWKGIQRSKGLVSVECKEQRLSLKAGSAEQ